MVTREYRIISSTRSTYIDTVLSLENQVNLHILNNWQLEGGVDVIKISFDDVLQTEFVASQAMSRMKVND